MANPFGGFMQPNSQAVNRGSLLSGLTQQSGYKPKTGTATGDRAANDFVRSMQMSNNANLARESEQQNLKTGMERQAQAEQFSQDKQSAQMARYRNASNQRSQQSQLAMSLLSQRLGLQADWQTSLLGMLR
jgi:hypothetical protein